MIEELTGKYMNTYCYKYKREEINNKWVITSIEAYIYGKDNHKIVLRYEKLLPDITEEILYGIRPKIYHRMVSMINKSPKLDTSLILYRGLSINLDLKEGDIYDHRPFIWCSFHQSYAKCFMYDTSDCYDKYGFQGSKGRRDNGCLLEIHVPKNTPYYERPINPDFAPCDFKSEIILIPSKLKIDKILGNNIVCSLMTN